MRGGGRRPGAPQRATSAAAEASSAATADVAAAGGTFSGLVPTTISAKRVRSANGQLENTQMACSAESSASEPATPAVSGRVLMLSPS